MADSITCPVCKRTSWNPTDVRLRFCGNCELWHEDLALPVYVIYQNPSDAPGKFVLRVQFATRAGAVLPAQQPEAVVDTLDAARAHVPPGLVPFLRQPDDDPVIVETWL